MKKINKNKVVISSMIIIGIFCFSLSTFYVSSFLAIIGSALFFWGFILLYITPSRQIPLSFLTISTFVGMSNIKRVLTEFKFTEKGIYLPPKNLKDAESSLIYIPKKVNQALPQIEETKDDNLLSDNQNCLFLTPPGFQLSKLYEEKLGMLFTKMSLSVVEKRLPSILTENLGFTENLEIRTQENKITFELKGNIFKDNCIQTQKNSQVHETIGCLLSSSFACVLAKVTGKAVTIESEEHSADGKTTTIIYLILEE